MNRLKFSSLVRFVPILFAIALFVLPFVWYRHGEIDLGGDFSRLYLYAPWRYLQIFGLYSIVPEGIGRVTPNQYYLPYLLFLAGINQILRSPYLLIHVFSGLKLAVGFLAMYAIVRNFVGKRAHHLIAELSALLAGIFYIFSPSVIGNMNNSLLSHDQVFLNPLMFYLMLRFIQSKKWVFVAVAFCVTLLFSGNFSWFSAPPMFAFYPIAIVFLMLYAVIVLKSKIPYKKIGFGLVLFLGLHLFHLLPEAKSLLTQGSYTNVRFFDRQTIVQEGVQYFIAVLSLSKASLNFLFPSTISFFAPLVILVPLTMILGVCLRKTKHADLPLVMSFFVLTFFLVTANITHIGVEFYKRLFYIPGFSMFRNFIGQWQFVYNFFAALFLGLAAEQLMLRTKKYYGMYFISIVLLGVIVNATPFISGNLANPVRWGSKGVRTAIIMDPAYLRVLDYIHALPSDGKILTLPFTDWGAQVVHGLNNAAYVGPSTISYLAGKPDFSGYQMIAPFPEIFFRLSREKNYAALRRLFRLLNIRYIYHNSAHNIYDDIFPQFPYTYARLSLPDTQDGMTELVQKLGAKKIFSLKSYNIYELSDFLPIVYVPTSVVFYQNSINDWYGQTASFFINDTSVQLRQVYADQKDCGVLDQRLCETNIHVLQKTTPKLTIIRINPTRYKIGVSGITGPFLLAFLQGYDKAWTAYISDQTQDGSGPYDQSYLEGDVKEKSASYATDTLFDTHFFSTRGLKAVASSRHILVNGYANGWYITNQDIDGRDAVTIILEMRDQKYFVIGLTVSFACALFLTVSILFSIIRNRLSGKDI
ncbi:MAG: hypothetical protein AAB937_00225 [Patescibacteria group bacterium]|mgnify:FL=1